MLILIVAGLICACDDEPATRVVFEMSVKPGYQGNPTWIMVSDPEGRLLGMSEVVAGEDIQISATLGESVETMNVTFVNSDAAVPPTSYYFDTYADVPVGSRWIRNSPVSENVGPASGDANLQITNIPANTRVEVSSVKGSVLFNETVGPDYLTGKVLVFPGTEVFISAIGPQAPKYVSLESVEAGANINLDYETDFVAYENVVPIPFTSVELSGSAIGFVLQGFKNPIEQTTSSALGKHYLGIYFGPFNDVQIGYNSDYEFYAFNWWADLASRSIFYTKIGEPPDPSCFVVPAGNFNITNSGFNEFDYSVSGEFDYLTASWAYNLDPPSSPVVFWSVSRPVGSRGKILNEIPPQLIASTNVALTGLTEKLDYRYATFVHVISGDRTRFARFERDDLQFQEEEYWSFTR